MPPPSFVADQLEEQVQAIRTGLTPRRLNPRPPADIAKAVANAKREAQRIRNSPKNSDAHVHAMTHTQPFYNYPHTGPTKPVPLFSSLPNASVDDDHKVGSSPEGVMDNRSQSQNAYSIGAVPKGPVSWRYVDVLASMNKD